MYNLGNVTGPLSLIREGFLSLYRDIINLLIYRDWIVNLLIGMSLVSQKHLSVPLQIACSYVSSFLSRGKFYEKSSPLQVLSWG